MDFIAITVASAGVQVTAGAASATVAIPNTADGRKARFVRIQATAPAYVRPVVGATGTCAVSDVLLNGTTDLILAVRPFTHIAYLQEATAPKINITPVEF